MYAVTVDLHPLTDEQFWQLCQRNRDLRFERTPQGAIIIMAPTGSDAGSINAEITYQLQAWSRSHRALGRAFDSSTGVKLPNGADRSPDAAWVRHERLCALTVQQKRGFAPLCPDFVIELKSPTDDIEKLRAKMEEYVENGAALAWLLNPDTRQAEIYRPKQPVERCVGASELSAEPLLPGFKLDLLTVWGAAADD